MFSGTSRLAPLVVALGRIYCTQWAPGQWCRVVLRGWHLSIIPLLVVVTIVQYRSCSAFSIWVASRTVHENGVFLRTFAFTVTWGDTLFISNVRLHAALQRTECSHETHCHIEIHEHSETMTCAFKHVLLLSVLTKAAKAVHAVLEAAKHATVAFRRRLLSWFFAVTWNHYDIVLVDYPVFTRAWIFDATRVCHPITMLNKFEAKARPPRSM